jgi:photosystem II stability/assembly factor-like uncharacterized protein
MIGTTGLWHDVTFYDIDNGWVVGASTILKTTDGGTTWIPPSMTPLPYMSLRSVFFTDANNGFVAGGNCWFGCWGVILGTTNGGNEWSILVDNLGLAFSSIFFSDANNGMVVDYSGTIHRTTNGGTTWTSQSSGTTGYLYDVSFTDANNGWVVGYDGIILHTTNGGVTFIEEEKIDEVPTDFLLSQNYPNPFNSSSVIKYSIPKSSQVTLKIFNTLGEEIEALVNEEKAVGTYELNWNAANLPSGVYFYRLQAGDYVQTRKMILLK